MKEIKEKRTEKCKVQLLTDFEENGIFDKFVDAFRCQFNVTDEIAQRQNRTIKYTWENDHAKPIRTLIDYLVNCKTM